MKFIYTAFLLLSLSLGAQARVPNKQFDKQPAPATVLARMPEWGRSVLFQQVEEGAGEKELFCHVYKLGETYFLELLQPEVAPDYRLIQSVSLGDTPHSTSLNVAFLWLQPKRHRGPIIKLYDQDFPGDWDGSTDLIVFPDGLEGRNVQSQYLEKFIGGTAINPSFDSYDERGLLFVHEWEVYEAQLQSHRRLYWNGRGFAERRLPLYSIIGPLFETYAQAKDFLTRPALQISTQILDKPLMQPSRYYKEKGLPPGKIVVILSQSQSQTEAEAAAKRLREQDIPCSVVRIY